MDQLNGFRNLLLWPRAVLNLFHGAQAQALHDPRLSAKRRRVAGEACQQSQSLARITRRVPHPYTIEDANNFLQGSIAGLPRIHFCIDIGGEAVGGIGLRPGEDVHRHTAEFGYWLAEEFWGQGIMSEIVPAFVDYCFKEFSLNRIFAMPHSNNPASARVLEKAGFALEGRLRKNVIKDGKILDSLLYAKTV
jgi:RimJ/RimL family protein N-acetyltransferase